MSNTKAPKGTFRTEIPFELNNGLIVIKVKLNDSDKEFEFVLDSGAPASIIYGEAFDYSKAKTVMSYKVSDSQGNATRSDYVLLNVKLGGVLFKDVFAAYSSTVGEYVSCIAPSGLIGADLMQTANWQIDFANKKIIISDLKKSSLPNLKDYQKVSCTKRSPFSSMPWLNVLPGLTTNLTVNGKLFKEVIIDLGSGGALTLPKNTATDNLFKNELKEVVTGVTSFGLLGTEAQMDTTFYYTSHNVYMQKMNLNNHTLDVSRQNHSLIGMQVFSDYTMFFDFRKNDLYFKPLIKENKSTEKKDFGCYLGYDSKNKYCYVSALYEGSSAHKAGIQLKDTIVEVNSQKLPAFNDYCEFKEWNRKLHGLELLILRTSRSADIIKLEKAVVQKR
jgi:hypothetical protein